MGDILHGWEKETIIIFNEADKEAEVFTYNEPFKKQLAFIADNYPDKCRLQEDNGSGALTFSINKKLIRIRKPYSEDGRKKISEIALAQNRIPPGNGRKEEAEN